MITPDRIMPTVSRVPPHHPGASVPAGLLGALILWLVVMAVLWAIAKIAKALRT